MISSTFAPFARPSFDPHLMTSVELVATQMLSIGIQAHTDFHICCLFLVSGKLQNYSSAFRSSSTSTPHDAQHFVPCTQQRVLGLVRFSSISSQLLSSYLLSLHLFSVLSLIRSGIHATRFHLCEHQELIFSSFFLPVLIVDPLLDFGFW